MKRFASPLSLAAAIILSLGALTTANAQTFTILHSFNSVRDGWSPQGELVLDSMGNLYGTAGGGGTYEFGAIFKLDTSGNETVLYSFGTAKHDGGLPAGKLALLDGHFYGTTEAGGHGIDCGRNTCGTIYETGSGREKPLYTFESSGFSHSGGLIADGSGNLYGVASQGNGIGIVFRVSQGEVSVLYTFGEAPDGAQPQGSLVIDSAGNLYGVTAGGGALGLGPSYGGTVFELSPNPDGSWSEQILYSFAGSAGWGPTALAMDLNGNLYGVTQYGGKRMVTGCNGCGVIFKLKRNPDNSWSERVLHTFGGEGDGRHPTGNIVLDKHGNLYGVCRQSTPPSRGAVYKLDASGNETILHSFTGGLDGADPEAGLIMDRLGNLYGTTSQGGSASGPGKGIVFEITP